MSRRTWWLATAVLVVVGAGALVFRGRANPSPLAKRGVRGWGQVQMKDSRPATDGGVTLVVSFTFADTVQRNHLVTAQVFNKGIWDGLKRGQDVRVYYLPESPETASLDEGGGPGGPKSGALLLVGWTALVAAVVTAYRAFVTEPKQAPEPGIKVSSVRK